MALSHLLGKQINVRGMDPMCSSSGFEVFSEAFVQPEREIGDCGVEISVRHHMAKVFSHHFTPVRVDTQSGIGLDEKRTPCRQKRMMFRHVAIVTIRVFEQVNIDRFV